MNTYAEQYLDTAPPLHATMPRVHLKTVRRGERMRKPCTIAEACQHETRLCCSQQTHIQGMDGLRKNPHSDGIQAYHKITGSVTIPPANGNKKLYIKCVNRGETCEWGEHERSLTKPKPRSRGATAPPHAQSCLSTVEKHKRNAHTSEATCSFDATFTTHEHRHMRC